MGPGSGRKNHIRSLFLFSCLPPIPRKYLYRNGLMLIGTNQTTILCFYEKGIWFASIFDLASLAAEAAFEA